MAVTTYLSVIEALRMLLTGEHAVTDATRQDGQRQVRELSEDRVYRGRKPQRIKNQDCVLLRITGREPENLLSGEDSCSVSFVEIKCLSKSAQSAALMAEGARQLLSMLNTCVETQAGTVCVEAMLVDEDEPDPEPPDEGSADYEFAYISVYRVYHTVTVPAGLS